MRQSLTLPVTIVATAMAALTAAEPPNDDSADSFDIEPPLLIPNRSIESSPVAASSPTPAPDVETLEKQFERAKKNEKSAERLCKIGVLSQVEVEQRALKIIRLECALANARLARANEEFIAQQSRFGYVAQPEIMRRASAGTPHPRASTWPRDHFCRSTMAPRASWPTTWNEFLPISMPITAIAILGV